MSQDLHSAHSRDASVSCELGVRHSWEDGPRRTDGNASAPGPAFSRPRRHKQNREARPAVSLVDVGAAGRGTQSRRSLQPAAAEATGQCGLCPQSDGLMVTGKGQVRLRPPGQAAEWPYPSCTCSKTSCLARALESALAVSSCSGGPRPGLLPCHAVRANSPRWALAAPAASGSMPGLARLAGLSKGIFYRSQK